MRYQGFISYSHAADGKLAPALQHALHRLARPLFKLRSLHIFRDKENLSANPALWPAIEKALSESEHLLLLASPESARSPWVVREVQWWITNRSMAKQLIVLTDGELVWDASRADFDWDKTTALPSIVGGRFSDEPLWVDLRWAKTANDLSLQHSVFRAAALDLAAPLHGKPKEELDSEDVRQYRKTKRLTRSAVAVLTALTITATVLAVYAVRQRNEAARQRDFALSRQTGSQALRVVDASLDTALLLGVEAGRRADTFDARNALLSALVRAPSLSFFLPGHHASVTTATFSPDGKVVASGSSDDGVVMFWDVERRRALSPPIVAHDQGVTSLAFSADRRWLASAGRDGTVQLWDTAARRPLGPVLSGHTDSVTTLAFSPDGRTLASGDSGGSILLWDVSTRKAAGAPLPRKHGAVTALAFDPGGASLASADGFGIVVLWNLRTPERVGISFSEGRFFVRALAFSPRGDATAFGFSGGNLIRWEVGQGQPRVHPLSTATGKPVTALDERAAAFSASATTAAVAIPGGDIIVADLIVADDRQALTTTATLEDLRPGSGILTVALSPNGEHMVSGYRDGTLTVWDTTETHALARPMRGNHQQDVTAVAFGPQGTTLVSASLDKTLILWDTPTLRPLGPPLIGHRDGVASVSFSPNGELMASGGYDGSVLLWEVAARRSVGEPLSGHGNQRVNRVVFSPDGSLLATAGHDATILLWDLKTRKPLAPPLRGHQKGVMGLAFSPDGRTLGSGGVDGTVVLWDVATRRSLGSPVSGHSDQPVNAVAFRPDGKALASVGGVRLNLWSMTERRTLESPVVLDPIDRERRQSLGGGLVFSPDGRMVVSGGNGRIVLWDLTSRQPLEPVLYGWGRVATTRLAMAPDGSVVAASNGDGVVLWDVGLASWQRRACRVANRDLTEEEWNKFVGPEVPYRRTCSELRSAP